MTKFQFTGFDSAWGGRNKGAICELLFENDRLHIAQPLRSVTWHEAIKTAASYDSPNHVIAIDQGLLVPNVTGMRPVERNLSKSLMADFQCGAHSSNRGKTSCYGVDAGVWQYLATLDAEGFKHEPLAVPAAQNGKYYFECYPHTAILGLFGIDRILKYKVRKRSTEDWRQLLKFLHGLKESDTIPVANVEQFFPLNLTQNKLHEDYIDAFIAAYTAAYWWRRGTQTSICIGSLREGYFVTPCTDKMRRLFASTFDATEIDPIGPAIATPFAAESAESQPAAKVFTAPKPTQKKWRGAAELCINDSGNIWCSRNPWMERDRCTDSILTIRFVDIDEEPQISFAPFRASRNVQYGMKPADEDSRIEWRFLADGASNETPEMHTVLHTYEGIPEIK